jgi:serine/threonine protein kinase
MNELKSQQTLLDAVAEEFTARFRQGERPSVEEYAARYPQAASQIRELLPSIVMLEQLKPPRLPPNRPGRDAAPPQQLGDYRIVREVGRGGMGIVYEAMQQSLGRRVAVKLLPHHAHLDARRLERFRIEAQAAARLHHTNIVPVFGLFESDGLQYYVMQFIDGRGLDAVLNDPDGRAALRDTQPQRRSTVKVVPATAAGSASNSEPPPVALPVIVTTAPRPISQTSDYYRQAARIGFQAANALHYAHAQGVLHRDIKPANLLLDQQGTVWITDFGLAKLRESDGLTATGDLVGTLQYMAPESLHGQSGPQSDIYSLGLTLYELLTRKPCFREASPAKLLKLISEQEPARPRSLDPSIPRDLETIVLKAIAREPRDRYATGGALADDLGRFLEDRPILARRSSSFERLWRWSRRNRSLATAATAALVSLVLAAVVGWWAYASTTQALNREENRRLEAELATQHAEANMQLSLHALEAIFAAVAPPDSGPRNVMDSRHDGPPEPREGPGGRHPPGGGEPGQRPRPRHAGGPGPGGERGPDGEAGHGGRPGGRGDSEEHRVRLLQVVLAFYERFVQQNEADPKLQSQAAKAQCHVGEIQARLGEMDKGRQAIQRSAASFAALVKAFPQQAEYLAGLLDTYRAEAVLARDCNDQSALIAAAEKVQSAGGQLIDAFPGDAHHALVAATFREIAELLESSGDLPSAEKFYRLSVPVAERLLGSDLGRPGGAAEDLGILYGKLAAVQVGMKRPDDARATLEKSIGHLLDQRKSFQRDQLLSEQYLALADLTDDAQQAAEMREKAADFQRAEHPRRDHPHGDGPRGPRPPDPFEDLAPRRPPPFGPDGGPPPPR